MIGESIGHYRITAKLGQGGMGAVYRATDTKLNREVAIKVLPDTFAADPDRLSRFTREAHVLASLNHPNIATIFGVEDKALVMELVEGNDLSGPLPLNEALIIARQIAEGLEAAHDKGIIHRDLKPANVKVTPGGVVKVLDFGLAKAADSTLTDNSTDSPTMTLRATQAGIIMGTASYMSPEQAAGKPVDRRADIWSFGVVLHELLTGKRLFQGETVSHTLAEVLKVEIDFNPIPQGPIRELVKPCLDRNIKNRLSHIAEARIAIERFLANPNDTTPATWPSPANRWPWAAAAIFLIAALAGWGLFLRKPSQPTQRIMLEVTPPNGSHFHSVVTDGGAAISPDGRTLAFIATTASGATLLHLRPLDSLDARILPGTEQAARPFWSPDSKSLGFVADGKLKRIDVEGGPPMTLCDARSARGGTWNDSGLILFADQLSGLQAIPASGGVPSPVTRLNTDAGETAHYYPTFLPGGKEFLYLGRNRNAEKMGVFMGSLDGKPAALLVQTKYRAIYDAVSRHLLYMQGDGTMMARSLELGPKRLYGEPAVVAEQVGLSPANGFANISVSATGSLFYERRSSTEKWQFAWRNRAGQRLETTGQSVEGSSLSFRLSPDGTRAALTAGTGSLEIWVLELARGVLTRLTFNTAVRPVWSADGKYIFYRDPIGVYRKSADGNGDEELLWKMASNVAPHSASPDGKHLLIGINDILTLPLIGQRKPEPYLQTRYTENGAAFSPDGRWVAYSSNESGRPEIYIQGFPERRGKIQLSSAGGVEPYWRADGKELYWRAPDQTLMAATVDLQALNVHVGEATPLFPLTTDSGFQPARDGKRFLVLEPVNGQQQHRHMVIVQNWAAGLGR